MTIIRIAKRTAGLRSRRRGLSPAKVVFVYFLSLVLVSWHQTGRLAGWFEDLALARQGWVSDAAFTASAFLSGRVVPHGPAQLNRAEDAARDWLLALASSEPAPDEPAAAALRPAPLPAIPEPGRVSAPVTEIHIGLGNSISVPSPALPAVAAPAAPPPAPDSGPGSGESGGSAGMAPTVDPDPNPSTLTGRLTTPPPAPEAAPAAAFNPAKVLLLGDSMMLEGLGPPLQRELKKYEGLTVHRDGRYGTGLARLDAFDWLTYFDQILDKYTPDLVILTIGANDPQDIIDAGKKRLSVGGEDWNAVYGQRAADLLARAAAKEVRIFWVGLPVMGQEPYGGRVVNINRVARAACEAAANCRFWDSTRSVADSQGRYTVFLPDGQGKTMRVRAKDAIHLTESGGRVMTEKFLAETADWADYRQPEAAAEDGPPEEAAPPPPAPAAGDRTSWLPPSKAPAAPSAGDGEEPEPEGRVTGRRFFSEIRGKETGYYLAVPEISPARPGPFPVVLLLHGAWDGADAWLHNLGAARLADLADQYGLILAMPDGEPFGWYLDGRETAIESYLVRELLPRVLGHPAADPGRVGLTGLSMGGHGALTLALKHPDLFQAAGSMSGVTDLAAHADRKSSINRQLRLDRVLGPAGAGGEKWRAQGAHGLTERNPKAWAGRPVILSVGLEDPLTLTENRAYHRLLTELGVAHAYSESPGGHDWTYWSAQLPIHLDFLARAVRLENAIMRSVKAK